MSLAEPPGGWASTVILVDRVADAKPPYCIHGESLCRRCERAVWLGTETLKAAMAGASPLCLDCADEVLPKDATRLARVEDHLRADGPHEEGVG